MPITQTREVSAAKRLHGVRYAIRDLACVADEVIKQGHKVLPLNVGDPLNFDFQTPPHIIDAVHKAMRDGKNGYAPSPGIPEALDAIRGEAVRKGISTVQDVFVTSGVSETVDPVSPRWSIPARISSHRVLTTRSTRPFCAS